MDTERERRVCATDHHLSAIIPFMTFSLKPLMTLTGRARKKIEIDIEEVSVSSSFFTTDNSDVGATVAIEVGIILFLANYFYICHFCYTFAAD
ncbi:MAG: hypothetical protein IKR25_12030 [Muribaculaceae bacterium]|nr:hypothetical protein [Muribaculaceae bacterium]